MSSISSYCGRGLPKAGDTSPATVCGAGTSREQFLLVSNPSQFDPVGNPETFLHQVLAAPPSPPTSSASPSKSGSPKKPTFVSQTPNNSSEIPSETPSLDPTQSTSLSENSGACFPGDSLATLANGSQVRMDQLRIGDVVQSSPSTVSEVFLFTHRDAQVETVITELDIESGLRLRASGSHLLIRGDGVPTAAGRFKAGDIILDGRGEPKTVLAVRKIRSSGLYHPQTMDGRIVVDGIQATTFTETVPPLLAQLLLSVDRMLYHAGVSLIGSTLESHSTAVRSYLFLILTFLRLEGASQY